jgi:hypothetical protein
MKFIFIFSFCLILNFPVQAQYNVSIYGGLVGPLGVEIDGNIEYLTLFGSLGTSAYQELMGTLGAKANMGIIKEGGGFISFHPGFMQSIVQFDSQTYAISQLEFGLGHKRDFRLRFGGGYGLKSDKFNKFYSLDLCVGYSF